MKSAESALKHVIVMTNRIEPKSDEWLKILEAVCKQYEKSADVYWQLIYDDAVFLAEKWARTGTGNS